jgi:hypothetical protein
MSNLGIYWNEKTEFIPNANPHGEMEDAIWKNGGISNKKMNYLIMMTFSTMVSFRKAGRQTKDPEMEFLL